MNEAASDMSHSCGCYFKLVKNERKRKYVTKYNTPEKRRFVPIKVRLSKYVNKLKLQKFFYYASRNKMRIKQRRYYEKLKNIRYNVILYSINSSLSTG